MKQFIPFFGEIVNRNDLDFLNAGNRDAFVNTHNDLTDNLGGIVSGFEVKISADGKSIFVNPGILYSAGSYNQQNNSGGGERGQMLNTYYVTNLPSTPDLSGSPQFLLVYAKITSSNKDPLNPSQLVTSRNLQTGENVPIRQFPEVSIIVTNPNTKSALSGIEGVPLAYVQVDYNNITPKSSDGTIQVVDETVRRNYTVGKAVDLVTGQILAGGIPDNLIIARMFADNSIGGTKFSDNAVSSSKLAVWDGVTAFNNTTGSGVANQHLKSQAVTIDKINYVSGVSDFGTRNYIANASFEIVSGTTTLPASWDISTTGTTSATLLTFASDPTAPKFGNTALKMTGGFDGSNSALGVSVSQIVDMGENLLNKPISAFFWAKQFSATDFTKSGSTGLRASIEFLDDTTATTIQGPTYFGVVSGVTTTDYLQYTTTAPVIYTGTQACSKIKITVGGKFSGGYYVDGIMLTESSLIPRFDVNPSEYIEIGVTIIDFNTGTTGQVGTSRIANNAIDSSKLQDKSVTVSKIPDGSITGSKINSQTITSDNILNGTITTAKLDPAIIFGVPSGFVIFTATPGINCPAGWTDVTSTWAGKIAIGVNPSSPDTELATVGGTFGTAATNKSAITNNTGSHAHSIGGGDVGGNGTSRAYPGTTTVGGAHAHNVPFVSVKFCQAP